MNPPSKQHVRRRLEELHTLYSLKPHFRDVIVEGRDDVAWIEWYLKEHDIKSVKVYAVDDRVTVPADVVKMHHADVNARGRVVALAATAAKWDLPSPAITCIIDGDYDLINGQNGATYTTLLRTDYAAMEVYALEDRPLSKFLATAAKSDIEAKDIKSFLKPSWSTLYALRYVLHHHHHGSKLVEKFADKCIDKFGEVVTDAQELLRTAKPSPDQEMLSHLLDLHAKYVRMIPEDSLQGIRGHDIAPLLIRFLKLKNHLANVDTIESLLKQSIELEDFNSQRMFMSLLERIRG